MKKSEKTQTLENVEKWGKIYIEQADIVLGIDDIEALEQYRVQLGDFIDDVKNRWMGKQQLRRLKHDKQEWLRSLFRKLADLEMEIASHIVVVRRDEELLIEMDRLAFPESVEGIGSRDLSCWNKSPLFFPDRLLNKLASAAVP